MKNVKIVGLCICNVRWPVGGVWGDFCLLEVSVHFPIPAQDRDYILACFVLFFLPSFLTLQLN